MYIRVQAWVAPLHVFWPEQAGLSSKMSAHRSPQEAPPVLSCPLHRTGRLFVEMPFETPGDDMSQDVSYSRDHRSRTSLFRKPQEGTALLIILVNVCRRREESSTWGRAMIEKTPPPNMIINSIYSLVFLGCFGVLSRSAKSHLLGEM